MLVGSMSAVCGDLGQQRSTLDDSPLQMYRSELPCNALTSTSVLKLAELHIED